MASRGWEWDAFERFLGRVMADLKELHLKGSNAVAT